MTIILIAIPVTLVTLVLLWKVLTIRDKTMRYRRALKENERWLKDL